MIKSKRMRSILLTASLTLGLSLFIWATAYAATYTAVNGDSLFKISQRYNTTVKNLMNANELNNTSLNIGQTINIPELTASTPGTTAITPATNMSAVTVISEPAKATTATTVTKPSESTSVVTKSAEVYSTPTINRGLETTRTPANVPTAETLSTLNNPTVDTAYSASDLDLLSRLITAEAQGESYDTKVAVGAVVMNRVKSGSFPNSISEVIYQNINGYYQFTPVVNGWIDKPADSDSIKAAKSASNGTDPTNNSLFYYDNKTTNPWMLAKPVSIQIGNMLFAY